MMGCPCISVYMKAVCEYTPRVHSRKIFSLYHRRPRRAVSEINL